MNAHILVVDDSRDFGRRAAELISIKTGFPVGFVSDADAACVAVEREHVAVVVLDERMPGISGTELFVRLHQVNPNLRAIMLTGEANADEVGRALSLGYKDYLSKSRIAELPERVATQYLDFIVTRARSEAGLDNSPGGVLLWPRNLLIRKLRGLEVRRTAILDLGQQAISESSWTTVLRLNAGEERKVTYGVSDTLTLQIEHESQVALKNTLKLRPSTLLNILESAAEFSTTIRNRRTETATRAVTHTTEQLLSLPNQQDPESPHFVRVRQFQEAVIRQKKLVTLLVLCRRCRTRSTVPVVVLESTGQVATRHKDYLRDGSSKVVETGVVELSSIG